MDFSMGSDEPAMVGYGPVVFGVPWACPAPLITAAARLARDVDAHLVCAFVDPASYLAEWDSPLSLHATSLDPARNVEALFPAEEVKERLESYLGPSGSGWSFRVLNGAVAPALARLAASTGASMLVVGGPRPGVLARFQRILEGSVRDELAKNRDCRVVVLPLG